MKFKFGEVRQLNTRVAQENKRCNKTLMSLTKDLADEYRAVASGHTPFVTGNLKYSWKEDGGVTKSGKNFKVNIINDAEREGKPDTHYASWVFEGHDQEVGRYVAKIGKRLVQPHVDGIKVGGMLALKKIQLDFEDKVGRTVQDTVDRKMRKMVDG